MVCGFMYARMKKPRLILGGFFSFVNESNMFYSCQNNLQQHCLLHGRHFSLQKSEVIPIHSTALPLFSQNCKKDCKIKALFAKCEI